MARDAAWATAKLQSFNDAFEEIGTSKSILTQMPRSKDNREPIAWELLVSKHLKRLADAREKKASKDAVKANVIIDPDKQPLPQGANSLLYAGEVVEVACEVGTPQTRLDLDGLLPDLEKAGIKLSLLHKLITKHTFDNRAPHKFVATLVTARLNAISAG